MPLSELLCTDTASVALAARLGADRIELCAALEVGGVTPGPGLIHRGTKLVGAASEALATGVVVLVRPRRGDFVYDAGDFEAMLGDCEAARRAGASGVAAGVLLESGAVDVARTLELMAAAHPLPLTFHRAVDRAPEWRAAAAALVALGVPRILTSGGAPSAWEGRQAIRRLVAEVGDDVEVIAAGGVRGENAARILEATGAHAIHGSCGRTLESVSAGPGLGHGGAPPETSRTTLDEASARAFVAAARAAGPLS